MSKLSIVHYETGWDKGWKNGGEMLTIDAHAPSKIVLRAEEPLAIGIRAKVREGGRNAASTRINGRDVNYDTRLEVSLDKGQLITVEAHIDGSKDQCWNYWEIDGASIVPPAIAVVSFWRDAHLGDSLGMLIASENYCRQNRMMFRIKSTPLFQAIYELFVFSHIELVGDEEGMIHVHPFGYNFEELGWINGIARALQLMLGGTLPETVEFPNLRSAPRELQKEDVVLVQLDSRSGGVWTLAMLKKFLTLYSGEKIAVVGGPDTSPYLGTEYEYRKGGLPFIASQLLACKKFVGVDSGIAHLACILGLQIDILFSPAVSERLVRGAFGCYPRTPVYKTISETRRLRASENRLLLVSTTNGWNLGDDLIREGVFNLLEFDSQTPVVWINRSQVTVPDPERKSSWSPLWKRLRNFENPRALVENASALIIAGTPEWIDTIQPFYRLAADTGLPIWIIGVGGTQFEQLDHLTAPRLRRVIKAASVRDEHARWALEKAKIASVRFFDPAFHSSSFEPDSTNRFVFNPRLDSKELREFYSDLYLQLRDKVDVITVHEPSEYNHACDLFDKPVYYNSDFRKYIDLYRSTLNYVGGRMHGAIPCLASGASVHLICHEQKHEECSWLLGKLDHPDALTVWPKNSDVKIPAQTIRSRFNNKNSIARDFEEHRSFLRHHGWNESAC